MDAPGKRQLSPAADEPSHMLWPAVCRYCCKKILRIRASNIDSRSVACAQYLFKNSFFQIRLLRIFTRKLLRCDFCNKICQLRILAPQHAIIRSLHPRAAGMTRDCQPKRLGGGFEVDDEPEARRLLDWDVGKLTYSITSSVGVSPNQEKQT